MSASDYSLNDVCEVLIGIYKAKEKNHSDPLKKFKQVFEATKKDDGVCFAAADSFGTYLDTVASNTSVWYNSFPVEFGSRQQFDKIRTYFNALLKNTDVRGIYGEEKCKNWSSAIEAGFKNFAYSIADVRAGAKKEAAMLEEDDQQQITNDIAGEIYNVQPDSIDQHQVTQYLSENKLLKRRLAESTQRIGRIKDIFLAFATKKCTEDEFHYISKFIDVLVDFSYTHVSSK